MTNKQTIDGVSRDLIERLSAMWPAGSEFDDNGRPVWLPHVMQIIKELRALLDAERCTSDFESWWAETGEQLTKHEVGLKDLMQCAYEASPAAQPQGEVERLRAALSTSAEPKTRGEPVAWMFKYLSHSDSPPYRSFEVTDLHQNPKAPGIEQHTALYAEQPEPSHSVDANEMGAKVVLPFAEKVIRKLQRYQECTDDGQGADIGRHWFDLLTQLRLLNRVQRSPALWEITQQGEDALEVAKLNGIKPDSSSVVRRAFICKGCEGVYADEAVSHCDCMCEPEFIEGEIRY